MRPQDLIKKIQDPFDINQILDGLALLAKEISKGPFHLELFDILQAEGVSEDDIQSGLKGISDFLKRDNLETKLKRELGSLNPFKMTKIEKGIQEKWSPLGLLVHITPSNAWSVPFLSGVEGLISGNLNFLKLSSSDSDFTLKLIEKFNQLVDQDHLKNRIVAQRISSKETELIQSWLNEADGVVAWGGEETIESLRKMTPRHARFIDWGHKISFSVFTKHGNHEMDIDSLVTEVCANDQQACSAPQVVYLCDATNEELSDFAQKLARSFETNSRKFKNLHPSDAERSEITVVSRMQELKKAKQEGDIISGVGWRILIDPKSALRPSPLYRSLWVKPLKTSEIISTLRPMRTYLQTLGLSCSSDERESLEEIFYKAGVLRITSLGFMQESYLGEPHDGVYALNRYVKRVSSRIFDRYESAPIMHKSDFQELDPAEEERELTFRSGGSSGEPKFSYFTYDDYKAQMQLSAKGLLEAGLDVKNDKVMNLFYAGGLYGGFISFFTILETIKAHQLPMTALSELEEVAKSIIRHKANTLIGMPSYLISLFQAQAKLLKDAKVVKKIFYGGEHLQKAQIDWLKNEFGVELIKSAAYGSVDAGPLGYQCRFQEGSRHHLHTQAHDFEIVQIDQDLPSSEGRLLVTTGLRGHQKIVRYDIGDLVRKVMDPCPCGREGLIVDLLGRHGDVFRIGASFFNYAQFSKILSEDLHYGGEFQIVLKSRNNNNKEEMVFILTSNYEINLEQARSYFLNLNHDLKAAVEDENVLDFSFLIIKPEQIKRNPASGKLIHIIDERKI